MANSLDLHAKRGFCKGRSEYRLKEEERRVSDESHYWLLENKGNIKNEMSKRIP